MTHEARCKLVDILTSNVRRSDPDIGQEVGCAPSTVRAYRKSLGVKRYDRPDIDWSGVDWSKTPAQIATEMGCRVNSVHRQRRKAGKATPTRRAWTPAEDARVLAHEVADHTLARELGCTVAALRTRRQELRARRRVGMMRMTLYLPRLTVRLTLDPAAPDAADVLLTAGVPAVNVRALVRALVAASEAGVCVMTLGEPAVTLP